MKYPEIQALYKYMSWNDFTKESIELGSFWFSSPTRFNDPIDCGISLNTIGNTPLLTNLISSGLSEIGKATGVAIKNPSQSRSITESVQQFASSLISNTEALGSEMSEARLDHAAGVHIKEKFASAGILSLSELGIVFKTPCSPRWSEGARRGTMASSRNKPNWD
jgi:hypothetical protein